MITKLLSLQFIKKSPFYGSCQNMQYCIAKKEETLSLCIYPGPFSYDVTPEEKKQFFTFPFTDDGYDQALEKLNEEYNAHDWKPQPLV